MSLQPMIIPASKGKLVKLLIFAIIFVIAGTFVLTIEPDSRRSLMSIAFVRYSVAFAAIAMGAVAILYFIIKMFDKKPGLIVDPKGITDNASGVSAGFIPWEDIRHIYATQVMSEKFVMIGVSNPEMYIKRQTKFLKRKAMSFNYKAYGSPISITSNGLKISHDELLAILNEMWGKFKDNSE